MNNNNFFRNVCIVMIWCAVVYSSIIQHMLYQLPYGMLVLGVVTLSSFVLANGIDSLNIFDILSKENICMVMFMACVFLTGLLFSPNKHDHITQWITCMEYLLIQIVIASIIYQSGTDTFHILLLLEAVVLAILFLYAPVNYHNSGRYSLSNDVNPNALGMSFAAGIWTALYRQQTSKQPLFFSGALVILLLYCIILTGSRKSMIGASLIIVLWLFFCYLPNLKGYNLLSGIISLLVMLGLIYIMAHIISQVYVDSVIKTRMENLLYESAEGNRSNMYRDGYKLIKANPLFGIGFGGFAYYYGDYSHATIVEVPVSGGIVGTILYFGAYYISIKKQLFIHKQTNNTLLEHRKIKMIMILFGVMVFYSTCIIHPYQFDSAIIFGIILGETAYLEKCIHGKQEAHEETKMQRVGSKYIKNV